ncbi:YceI family protein [Algivirga pacifica]|uniref:Lipid/polyisoprenoid-binding YceI-like domain-containing protein n=1 Tax=Algivirga pacifica TaxID=1162670 RepID=A0ABP9D9S8_9BACT
MRKIIGQIILYTLLLSTLQVMGQEEIKRIVLDNQEIKIQGTSTLHDWESDCTQSQITIAAAFQENRFIRFDKIEVSIPVKGIKSGKGLMDKNTYDALKADQYSDITFVYTSRTEHGIQGTLTIAGISKPIIIKAKQEGNVFQGSYTFKMSDYGITPPTVMMGTIKTGDEIKIVYKVTLPVNQL